MLSAVIGKWALLTDTISIFKKASSLAPNHVGFAGTCGEGSAGDSPDPALGIGFNGTTLGFLYAC